MQGRFVFTQLVEHLPLHRFRRLVDRYDGHRYVKRFSCLDQFLCMGKSCLRFKSLDGLLLDDIGRIIASTPVDDLVARAKSVARK